MRTDAINRPSQKFLVSIFTEYKSVVIVNYKQFWISCLLIKNISLQIQRTFVQFDGHDFTIWKLHMI